MKINLGCMQVNGYLENQKLREDANRIQQILSDFFVASDVHVMQEPKNFALRYIHTTGGRREKKTYAYRHGLMFSYYK